MSRPGRALWDGRMPRALAPSAAEGVASRLCALPAKPEDLQHASASSCANAESKTWMALRAAVLRRAVRLAAQGADSAVTTHRQPHDDPPRRAMYPGEPEFHFRSRIQVLPKAIHTKRRPRGARPNQSFEPTANGVALGPRSAKVHDAPRGPSTTPLSAAQLQR